MKKQLIRAAATTVLGLSLTTGIAAADIGNTGPSSHNKVETTTSNHARLHNNNNISGSNSNGQSASTGKAEVEHNTTGGDASSGAASNSNEVSAMITVDNSGAVSGLGGWASAPSDPGSIDTTGPNSSNEIKTRVTNSLHVTNNNNVSFTNSSSQSASSGSAEVSGNTTGGSASTGDASNTNSSTFEFSVTN